MSNRRVLVVGTTPDYVNHIESCYPGRALFLTDEVQRTGAHYRAPEESVEIAYRLADVGGALELLRTHIRRYNQTLSGVACYDCEWLEVAAEIALRLGLAFPTIESVRLARDKRLSKHVWAEHGVRCPTVKLVESDWGSVKIVDRLRLPIVLKPAVGSGSALTFKCSNKYQVLSAFRTIRNRLGASSLPPIDSLLQHNRLSEQFEFHILAEEFVAGREYSADFVVHDNQITVIRVARKLHDPDLPFGAAMAYQIPARLPGRMNYNSLKTLLGNAAHALGLTRAICMVDFIVKDGEVTLLEMTPRIGGDCLPPLIERCAGVNTIGLALDFAEGRQLEIPRHDDFVEHVGLRIFSDQTGVLESIDLEQVASDPRTVDVYARHYPKHKIVMPPDDYDSWVLGHVIFKPDRGRCLKVQCAEMLAKVNLRMVPQYDRKLAAMLDESCRIAQ